MHVRTLNGLNGLRALCALCILLGHIEQPDFCDWKLSPIPIPVCCAYVFFVISGFLAGYRMDSYSSPIQYYKKKAIRILPLYYSYLLLSVIVYTFLGKTNEIISPKLWYYIFLVPGIPFCKNDGILPLIHLWFIGSLVLFYLVFPLFAKTNTKKASIVAIGITIIWFLLKIISRTVYGNSSYVYHFIGITSFDILFLGVFGGVIEKNGSNLLACFKHSYLCTFLSILSWTLFLLSGFYGSLIPAPVRTEYIAGLALIILITQQTPRPIPKITSRFFDWMGSISYEIYVVQIILIIFLAHGYKILELNISSFLIYLTCCITTILCAWLYKKGLGYFRNKFITQ